jgi:hypothetical protein
MRKGRWTEPSRSWHDTSVIYCQACGRLIPRRAWIFEGGAGELRVCSPDCEDLYEDYLKPTYGAMAAYADNKG